MIKKHCPLTIFTFCCIILSLILGGLNYYVYQNIDYQLQQYQLHQQHYSFLKDALPKFSLPQIKLINKAINMRSIEFNADIKKSLKLYYLDLKEFKNDDSFVKLSMQAQLDTDIYQWLDHVIYLGLNPVFIAIFYDAVNNTVISKIYFKKA